MAPGGICRLGEFIVAVSGEIEMWPGGWPVYHGSQVGHWGRRAGEGGGGYCYLFFTHSCETQMEQIWYFLRTVSVHFGSKVGQIGPKLDKSRAY